MLGCILSCVSVIIHKELFLPLFGIMFVIETLSVIIQVTYFKYTKRKYGQGKRCFLITPLHHHYNKLGMSETTISNRYVMITLILCIIGLLSFYHLSMSISLATS